MRRVWFLGLIAVLCMQVALVADDGAADAAPAAKGPPLPLHTIDGTSGVFVVPIALLVNPAPEGEIFGKPAVGMIYAHMGEGRHVNAFTITENILGRIELAYGFNHLDTADLGADVLAATGLVLRDDSVDMHNLSVRGLVITDGDFDQSWVPAVTVGATYKKNEDVCAIDNDLAGTLTALGIDDDSSWDLTLHATKMVTSLPRPVLVTVGARSSEAAHLGLLGFTDDREITLEGSVGVIVASNLVVAAEYREKPDDYMTIPGVIGSEDDWWSIAASYIANERTNITAGYAHFGNVLNHTANNVWGIAVKHEF